MPVVEVTSFEEALTQANNTVYGLSAYVLTRDPRRLMDPTSRRHSGELYVNRPCGGLVQGFHNGWRHPGLGGEDGKCGFDGYLRKKTMYVNWA